MRARGIYLPLLIYASGSTIRAFFNGIKTTDSPPAPSSDFAVENLTGHFTALALAAQQPPAPPQSIIDQLFSELQELGKKDVTTFNKSLFRDQKQMYEIKLKAFLQNEETKSLDQTKLCLSRAAYDARLATGDSCTMDPDYLLRKQLLNDKKLVEFVRRHPFNREIFVSLQTHGSLISSVNSSGDVELRAFQVPPGCSVTIISLTKPGYIFYKVFHKLLSVNDVIEKMLKNTDLNFVDITRFVKYISQQFYEFCHEHTDATTSEHCRLFKNGVSGFSGNVVALTYTEGEFLLDKRLGVSDPSEIQTRSISSYNWNLSHQEKNHDPVFLPLDQPIETTLSTFLLPRPGEKAERSNVLVLDATCSNISQEDSLEVFGDHYLAFVQQQCALLNLRGGRRTGTHRH